MEEQSGPPTEHATLSPAGSDPVEWGLVGDIICEAIAWGTRYSFFGSIAGPLVLLAVNRAFTIGQDPRFQSSEMPFVAAILGAVTGGFIGLLGGAFQFLVNAGRGTPSNAVSAARVGLEILGIVIVLGLEILVGGLGVLAGIAYWAWAIRGRV